MFSWSSSVYKHPRGYDIAHSVPLTLAANMILSPYQDEALCNTLVILNSRTTYPPNRKLLNYYSPIKFYLVYSAAMLLINQLACFSFSEFYSTTLMALSLVSANH